MNVSPRNPNDGESLDAAMAVIAGISNYYR